jgi:hypothetical protein
VVAEDRVSKSQGRKLVVFILSGLLVTAALFIVALVIENCSKPEPRPQSVGIIIACLYSVAASILASLIVVFASAKILGEPIVSVISTTSQYLREMSALTASSMNTGITQMFPRRAESDEVFFELLDGAWQHLDLLGVKMDFLARDVRFAEALETGIQRGALIRIALVDTRDETHLAERERYEGLPGFAAKAKVAVETYELVKQKCKAMAKDPSQIDLRFHRCYVPTSMMRVDDNMLFYTRLGTQGGSAATLFLVKRVQGGAFDLHMKSFEIIWANSLP